MTDQTPEEDPMPPTDPTAALRTALEAQAADENMSPEFRKGIEFASAYMDAWYSAPADDPVKRRYSAFDTDHEKWMKDPEYAAGYESARAEILADRDQWREDTALDAFYRAHILRVYRSPKKQAEYLTGQRWHDGREAWRPAVAAAIRALSAIPLASQAEDPSGPD